MQQGLRDRKKQQTRQAIIDSAHVLFMAKGYDATTINDIAASANCAPRTFFQYFASKEDLLLVGIDIFWDKFAEFLSAKPAEQSTLDAARMWMVQAATKYTQSKQSHMRMLADVDKSVRARVRLHSNERMRSILIPEFAKELSLRAKDGKPRILAAMVATIADIYYEDEVADSIDVATYIEQAFDLIKPSLDRLS